MNRRQLGARLDTVASTNDSEEYTIFLFHLRNGNASSRCLLRLRPEVRLYSSMSGQVLRRSPNVACKGHPCNDSNVWMSLLTFDFFDRQTPRLHLDILQFSIVIHIATMSDNGYSSSGSNVIRSLNINRRTRNASPSADLSLSTFDPDLNEALMSTRHNIEDDENAHVLPNLRATAQKYKRGYYNPPPQQPNPPTSAVNRQFQDFDHSYTSDEQDDHSDSIEVGRGMNGKARNTPSKSEGIRSSMLMDMGNNSLYAVTATPPVRNRNAPNLRREAATRRASAQMQRNSNSGLLEINGNAVAGSARSVRHQSVPLESPRNTSQSFLLPNMPNITELISGNYNDGTPIFSRSSKSKSKFASPNFGGAPSQPRFAPVNSIALPDDERAIFAGIQLMKDKITLLEENKVENERKIEAYENDVIELRAQLDAQGNLRRSDSALGSTDGEGGKNASKWQDEKSSE